MTARTIRLRERVSVLAPLVVFALLAALFYARLGAGDASRIPSALIGQAAPPTDLPMLEGAGRPALTNAELRRGGVTLVNVFASWCVPCRDEHATLMALAGNAGLAAQGVRLAGLAYKDDPANSLKFLTEGGNPFAIIGVDRSGRTGIDWGVYGVPETFVVAGDGTIAFKFVGPLTEASLRETLLPKIAEVLAKAKP